VGALRSSGGSVTISSYDKVPKRYTVNFLRVDYYVLVHNLSRDPTGLERWQVFSWCVR
jgi:hypothetical protein